MKCLSFRDKGKGETAGPPSPEALFAGQWSAIMSDELFQERLHTIVIQTFIIISAVSYYHLIQLQCIKTNTD